MSIVHNVKEFLASDRDHQTERSRTTEAAAVQLFRCNCCNNTYVSDGGMDSCPKCDESLENVPTERDLGQV